MVQKTVEITFIDVCIQPALKSDRDQVVLSGRMNGIMGLLAGTFSFDLVP